MENKEVNNTGQTLPNPTEYTTRKEYKRIFNSDIPYLRTLLKEVRTLLSVFLINNLKQEQLSNA
tara:strand:- start:2333 stop:2524 length:192 start_codon:yes stop_codon:yes gene_type:complete